MPRKHARSEKLSDEDLTNARPFQWDEKRSAVALALAQGFTWDEVEKDCHVSRQTIANWKKHPDFAAEVDRLSCMVDVSSRAQRLRIAMKIIRQKLDKSDRDLLEWLKFAQSETDGAKLQLAALLEAASPLADTGLEGTKPEAQPNGGNTELAQAADAAPGPEGDRPGPETL